MQVPWFERRNLASRCVIRPFFLYSTVTVSPATSMTWPSSAASSTSPASRAARPSTPVPMYGAVARSSGTAWRCMLAPIERAVRVVVLEERDQRGGHRHELLRRHVHVLDLVGGDEADLAPTRAHEHAVLEEPALLVDRRVRLRDDVLVLVVGREVRDLVGDPALLDLAVRRLDEAEPVDPRRSVDR